jgi:hypothetical protein
VSLRVEELDPKRHDRAAFDCGVEPLNRYIQTLATQHRTKGIASGFVPADSDQSARILAYYRLSAALLAFERVEEPDRERLPAYSVPTVRIGRLAGQRPPGK